MPKMFISNNELRNLLELATNDEKLALTKILDNSATTAYNAKTLQEKISLAGGNAVANKLRGQGTGYLDILDDVAGALEIKDRQPYQSSVQYFDEMLYINAGKYTTQEATRLGLEYASKLEEKIIVALIKKSYEHMIKQKKDAEEELLKSEKAKSTIELDIKHQSVKEKEIKVKINFEDNSEKKEELKKQRISLENAVYRDIEREQGLKDKIDKTKIKIEELTKRITDFDNKVNEVVKGFDTTNLGTLTGTAGLMFLANLGGFATYTFLTSMMSVVSFGTLGFGAYTAATSLLSIMIGPVGWAGLGLFVIFSFGKPKMSELMPIIATVGAIRQRVKYENIGMKSTKILANKVVKKTPPPPKVVHKISTDQNKAIEFSDNIEAWIDADTGLMWEIKTKENIEHRYVWSKEYIKTAISPDYLTNDVKDAFSYAQKLNTNNHAGFSDWRVPTLEELKTLLTKEKNNGYYIKYLLSKNITSFDDWSSTTYANSSGNAWAVYFEFGGTDDSTKAGSLYVRCVRGGQ